MSNNGINLKNELKYFNYSIDDFYIRIIIYMYEKIKSDIKEEYPNKWNIQQSKIKEAVRNKHIKMTRQTIYNLIHNNNQISVEKAEIILNVLNEIRRENGKDVLKVDDMDFTIYKR